MPSLALAFLLITQQSPPTELLCPGSRPRISPDGRWVALHRPVKTEDTDMRGNPVWRDEVWIRDVRTGEEKRLVEDAWLSGWINATSLVFRDGSTATVGRDSEPVKIAKPPADIHTSNRAWGPGGGRMAYIPNNDWSRRSPDPRKIHIVDGEGPPRAIDLGHSLFAEDSGVLAWSPDGKKLAYHQVFFRDGNLPVRRIGVIDIASGTNRFVGEGHPYGNRGFSLSERWGDSPGTWDAKGERFTFVTGRGGGEADVFVSNAAGTEVQQLTEDGECKWSPVLDPAGRRVAFCAGRLQQVSENPNWPLYELHKGRIRILDLYTSRELTLAPDRDGMGSNIAWLADGSGIVFDWSGEESMQVFKSILPAPPRLEPGAAIAAKPTLNRKERILKALTSESEAIFEWAAEESRSQADADIVAALRAALTTSIKAKQTQGERALLFAVSALNARDAAPEVIASMHSAYDANRRLAISMVGQWKLKQATEALLKILEELPEVEANVHAAGALAWLSHESGWKLLQRFSRAGAKETRGAVAYSLQGLADPKAVGILIGLVDDTAVLYTSSGGEHQVGDRAERALARITGVTFSRKPIAWISWWNEQAGRLPTVPTPNPALQKLDEDLRRREKEWQEKMRKGGGD